MGIAVVSSSQSVRGETLPFWSDPGHPSMPAARTLGMQSDIMRGACARIDNARLRGRSWAVSQLHSGTSTAFSAKIGHHAWANRNRVGAHGRETVSDHVTIPELGKIVSRPCRIDSRDWFRSWLMCSLIVWVPHTRVRKVRSGLSWGDKVRGQWGAAGVGSITYSVGRAIGIRLQAVRASLWYQPAFSEPLFSHGGVGRTNLDHGGLSRTKADLFAAGDGALNGI